MSTVELSIVELSVVELLVVELLVVLGDVVGDILGVFGGRGRSVVYHLSEIQLEKFWGRLFKFYNILLDCLHFQFLGFISFSFHFIYSLFFSKCLIVGISFRIKICLLSNNCTFHLFDLLAK